MKCVVRFTFVPFLWDHVTFIAKIRFHQLLCANYLSQKDPNTPMMKC